MRWIKHALYVPVMALLGSSLLLQASGLKVQESEAKMMYPVASAILKDAYGYIGSLKSFSFDAVTENEDVFKNKMIITYLHKTHIDLQRPGRLHVRLIGDVKNRSLYLSDGTYVLYDHDLNYYGVLKTPKSIDGTLDFLYEEFNIKTILANLLYSDVQKRLTPKEKGYYLGTSVIDGVVCHHLGFSNDKRELQVWVERSVRPLIRKFTVIDKKEKREPRSTTTIQWNLHPNLKASDFLFKVPEGATQISMAPYKQKGGKK